MDNATATVAETSTQHQDLLFISPNAADGFGGSGYQMAHLCGHFRARGISSGLVLRNNAVLDYVHPRAEISLARVFRTLPMERIPFDGNPGPVLSFLRRSKPRLIYVHAGVFFRYLPMFSSLGLKAILYVGTSAQHNYEILTTPEVRKNVIGIVSVSRQQGVAIRNALGAQANGAPTFVIRQGTYCYCSPNEDVNIDSVVPSAARFLISVGATRSYKQLDHFVELVDVLRRGGTECLGVVVGPITREWVKLQRDSGRAVRTLNGEVLRLQNVLFVGPSAYLGNWFARASCCVCTSTSYEGIPGFLREAMLSGCAVVSYNIGSVAELIRHRWNGMLIPPGDQASLAKASAYVLSDSNEMARMRDRAQRCVGRLFSASRHLAQTEEMVRHLCGTNGIQL